MATQITYNNTTGATATSSEVFEPVANFIIQSVGAIDSGVIFTVEQAPINEPTGTPASWTQAGGTQVFNTGTRLVEINYASGFKYRISKNAQAQANEVKFYRGHTTVLQSVYR